VWSHHERGEEEDPERDINRVTGQRSSGVVFKYNAAATVDDAPPLLEIVGDAATRSQRASPNRSALRGPRRDAGIATAASGPAAGILAAAAASTCRRVAHNGIFLRRLILTAEALCSRFVK